MAISRRGIVSEVDMLDRSLFLESEHFTYSSGDGFSLRDLIHLDLAGVGDWSIVGAEPGYGGLQGGEQFLADGAGDLAAKAAELCGSVDDDRASRLLHRLQYAIIV